MRKTRREKEQEAAELKRKEEEQSAAKAYAEFLETFEGKDSGRRNGGNFVRADTKAAYVPAGQTSQVQPSSTNAFRRVCVGDSVRESSTQYRAIRQSPSPPSTAPKPKGKRAMDSFLEELKRYGDYLMFSPAL